MKLTRCHEDVTDMGLPSPSLTTAHPNTESTPGGQGRLIAAYSSDHHHCAAGKCMLHDPKHNAVTMQLIQTASLLEEKLIHTVTKSMSNFLVVGN